MSRGAIRSIEKFAAAAVRRRTERFDHCFPRGITMGDIDSHVEINHHWLFIEYKLGDQAVSTGQWMDLYRLSQRPRMSVWIIWTTEDGFITHGQALGEHPKRKEVTEEAIASAIEKWVSVVSKAPPPPRPDRVLDILEVIAYLDAQDARRHDQRTTLLRSAIAALTDENGAKP